MKRESRSEHNSIHGSTERALEKARRLAPLEESASGSAKETSNNRGVIQVGTGELILPKDLTEAEGTGSGLFRLEPLAIVILVFALAFIGYITYLISIEPPEAKGETNTTIEIQR